MTWLIQSKEYLYKLVPLPLRLAETVAAVKIHCFFFTVSNLLISQLVGLMLELLVGKIQENRSHLNPENPRGLSPFTYCLIPLYEGTFFISQESQKGIEEQWCKSLVTQTVGRMNYLLRFYWFNGWHVFMLDQRSFAPHCVATHSRL